MHAVGMSAIHRGSLEHEADDTDKRATLKEIELRPARNARLKKRRVDLAFNIASQRHSAARNGLCAIRLPRNDQPQTTSAVDAGN